MRFQWSIRHLVYFLFFLTLFVYLFQINYFSNLFNWKIKLVSDVDNYRVSFNNRELFNQYARKTNIWEKGVYQYEEDIFLKPKSIVLVFTDQPQKYEQIFGPDNQSEPDYSFGLEFNRKKKQFTLIIHLSSKIWENYDSRLLANELAKQAVYGLLYNSKSKDQQKAFNAGRIDDREIELLNEIYTLNDPVLKAEKKQSFHLVRKALALIHVGQTGCPIVSCSGSSVCGSYTYVCTCSAGGGSCSGNGSVCFYNGTEGICQCSPTGCSGSTSGCGTPSSGCVQACYEPCNSESCTAYHDCDAPPPFSSPLPSPPPGCVYRGAEDCGDDVCCTTDGENTTNCSTDCGDPPAPTLYGKVGGLVFWDKNGDGIWSGDSIDARLKTAEDGCIDIGVSDVLIPGLRIHGSAGFDTDIDAAKDCDIRNDDEPHEPGGCTDDDCDGCDCGDGECEGDNGCGTKVWNSCFTVDECCKNGKWIRSGNDPANPQHQLFSDVITGGRAFKKTVPAGKAYTLSLSGLPSQWRIANYDNTVYSRNPNCSDDIAWFALQRANVNPYVISYSINDVPQDNPTVCAGETNSIKFTGSFYDSNEPMDNIAFNPSFEKGAVNWSSQAMTEFEVLDPGLLPPGDVLYNSYMLGNQVLRISDQNPADSFVVSDWIHTGASLVNKTFTLSFWARSETGSPVIGNIALQSYPQNGDWGNYSQYLPISNITLTTDWQFFKTSLTFGSDSRLTEQLRVVLRAPQNGPAVLFDGIMVQNQTRGGIFTDVKEMEIAIVDESIASGSFNSSLWQLRMRALIEEDNIQPNFRIWSPAAGQIYATGPRSGVQYDSASRSWMVSNDILAIPNKARLYGVGSGKPVSNFKISRYGEAFVDFSIDLHANFPIGNYKILLWTRDRDLAEDEACDGHCRNPIIEVTAGLPPDDLWDFHYLGDLTIRDCTADVSGTVYDMTAISSRASGCSQIGSLSPYNSAYGLVSVSISGGLGGTSYSDVDPNYLFPNLRDLLNYTMIASTDEASEGILVPFFCDGSYGLSTSFNLPDEGMTMNLGVQILANAWWQTAGGNIHSGNNIINSVPGVQWLMTDSGILSYVNSLSPGLSAKIKSSNPMYAKSRYKGKEYNYPWWQKHFEDITGQTSSSSNLSSYTVSDSVYRTTRTNFYGAVGANRKIVILNDASQLNITNNITVPSNSFLLIINNGKITINPNVTQIQGMFIANEIEFATAGTENDSQLNAQGNFIGWDKIRIRRDIGRIPSFTSPSVIFSPRSDFIYNAPDYVRRIFYTWRQKPG